ncbi:GNAT family N-acetyltransferase [Luteimonas sp. SDU82]|uniref:GNAT family N-acetyltransferase n=1 Tax=Luteimonas sp. SDU82 TaxID=3422592 RepID=UPI003EBDCE2A
MSPPPVIALRPARRDDVPAILALIRALAEYERLAHEVEADEDALAATLFGERPVAEVVMAEVDGDTAGFALFFHNYSTFLARPGLYLEDLFVHPRHRGLGVGRRLMAHLAQLALARGCGRFEWSVLDWNAPAIGFYRRLGAVGMDGWTTQRVTGEALRRLAADPVR